MIVIVLILLIITIFLFFYMKNNREKFDNHYYVATEASLGDEENLGGDAQYKRISPIPDNNYVVTPAVIGNKYVRGSDVVFKRFTQCDKDKEFIIRDGIVGDAETAGRDRICDELTECDYNIQYINSDIVTNSVGYRTNDNVCADIISCQEYEDIVRPEMPEKMFSEGVCERKGEIVVKIELSERNNLFLKKKIFSGSNRNFSSIQSIKDYFSSLKTKEDNYHKYIDRDTEFFVALDKVKVNILGDEIQCYHKIYDGFVSYMLDLRNDNILDIILRKHLYLEISFIERMTKNITGPLYLFILGKQVDENIPMKLFNADSLVFALVYKDQEDDILDTIKYKFDLIKYDIQLFYEYNKEMAIGLVSSNMKNLEYFLRTILFSKVLPNYKMQLYNKKGTNLKINLTAYYRDKVLNVTQTDKSLTRCDFEPEGETLFGCKTRCNNSKRCSNYDCNLICETCENENCLWNIKYQINRDLLVPESVIVKGFSGDKFIKLTWMKPQSPSLIEKYYIILSSPVDKELLDIYSVLDKRELCEYIISDLINSKPYDIYVVVKNDVGISKKSNKVTVVPSENSGLNIDDNNDSYSNSIENYYKQKKGDSFNLKKTITEFERKTIINDLKKVIKDDLKIDISSDSYNINIY